MQKKIGEVLLDYTFYKGKDEYTDGEIEDRLLEIVQEGNEREALLTSNSWPILYHLSDIRENIIEWYPMDKDATVLEIGAGCGAMTGVLSKKTRHVTCVELSEKRSLINAYRNKENDNIKIIIGNFQDIILEEKFDYVTLNGVWEYAGLYVKGKSPYISMLKKVKRYLKKDGKILIAIENKMGLKYWNGAPEDHTNGIYDGINDYIGTKNVRTFSRPEIIELLKDAGINKYRFYYPVPDYKLPEAVYTDELLPTAGSLRNYRKDYNASRIYNFFDAVSYDQICNDKMFSYFANSFFVECGESEEKCFFVKYSRTRKKEFRIATIIKECNGEKVVYKKALNSAAKEHILKLKENEEKWKGRLGKLEYITGYVQGDEYITSIVEGMDIDEYMYKYRNNPSEFLKKYCEIINKYLVPNSGEVTDFHVTDEFLKIFGDQYPDTAEALPITNIDLICSNLKLAADGKMYCFDYEWVFDFSIPYEYVLWRNALQLYSKYMVYLKDKISRKQFLINVGISRQNLGVYEHMENKFCEYVYGKGLEEDYLKNYRKSAMTQAVRFVL